MPIIKTGIVRHVSAFVVTPLVPPGLMLLVSLAGKPAEGMWVALFALPFTVGTTVLLGIPLYFLFQRLGWTSAWAYMAIGILCGLLASLFLFTSTAIHALATHESSPWTSIAAFSSIFCFLGGLSGLVFWFVARPDRPFLRGETPERAA